VFVVDAAVLLPHPPRAVTRVAASLTLLPRWCAGLRRVRFPAVPTGAGCVFTYEAADARLTLQAHTVAPVDGGGAHEAPSARPPVASVTHRATGDGLTLTWTLRTELPDGADATAGWAAGAHRPLTRLRARVEVLVDPGHPLDAVRAALCRTVARRVPADLERFRVLLERYEAGRPTGSPPAGDGEAGAGSTAPSGA
jgi:hypothetical protein